MEIDRYAIDAALSRVTVRAFARSTSAASGNSPTLVIRDFTGCAQFAPGTFAQASVSLKVNAGSLSVAEILDQEDRKAIEGTIAREVLEIERYPEINLRSSRVSMSRAGDGQYWVNLVGDLSLHGVTGTLPVAAQVALEGDTLRAHGEFTLVNAFYRLKAAPVPGSAALKLRDEVTCSFDILARRERDSARREGPIFAAEGL